MSEQQLLHNVNFDNAGLWGGASSRDDSDFQIDATDGFVVEADDSFGAKRAFTVENDGNIVGGIWGDGDTLFLRSHIANNIKLNGTKNVTLASQDLSNPLLSLSVGPVDIVLNLDNGELVITDLPTSAPLGPDRLFTQTASELGGSGSTKVLCVSSGSAPSAPNQPDVCKQSNALIISWNSVSGADSYDVQRSVGGGGFTDWKTGVSGTEVNDLDPASQPDTTYEYQVRACNSQGCSGYSTSSASTSFNTASSC